MGVHWIWSTQKIAPIGCFRYLQTWSASDQVTSREITRLKGHEIWRISSRHFALTFRTESLWLVSSGVYWFLDAEANVPQTKPTSKGARSLEKSWNFEMKSIWKAILWYLYFRTSPFRITWNDVTKSLQSDDFHHSSLDGGSCTSGFQEVHMVLNGCPFNPVGNNVCRKQKIS